MDFLRQASPISLPVETTFTHDLKAGAAEVALHYWPRKEGQSSCPSHLTLFILGNPGLLNYYIPFLTHLHNLLPPSHAIISTSHVGHTPNLKCPDIPLDLPAQLEAKVDLVKGLRSHLDSWARESGKARRQDPHLSVMGHSVGSWFLCELMKKLPDDIQAGYMLFPTVGWIADTWNGRTLWPMFHRPMRTLLPTLSSYLGPILPWTTFPPTTLSLLRSPETIRHALELSKSEMDLIREPDLEWFSSQNKEDSTKGLYGAWSSGNLDGWVGREGPMVQECLGGPNSMRARSLEGIPHAFCLSDEHSEIVARVVANWITKNPQV